MIKIFRHIAINCTKLIVVLLSMYSMLGFSQDTEYKIYSYTEFFELIEKEQDTLFELNDAVIQFNEQTDERFRYVVNPINDSIMNPAEQIVIDKSIDLDNVHFSTYGWRYAQKHEDIGSLWNIHFKKDVTINNTASLSVNNCKFDGYFSSSTDKLCDLNIDKLRSLINYATITITRSSFNDFELYKTCDTEAQLLRIQGNIRKNTFNAKSLERGFSLYLFNNGDIRFEANEINNTIGTTFIRLSTLSVINFLNNHFNNAHVLFSIVRKERELTFSGNTFSSYVHFFTDKLDNQDYVEYSQIRDHFIPGRAFFTYYETDEAYTGKRFQELDSAEQAVLNQKYLDSVRYYNSSSFSRDLAFKGLFYDHYKNKYETETANEVYMEMKDMETRRLEVLYDQNPSFKTYFKWKVNQFLKLFSDYGTEPSKAIVFSVYVIFFFGIIYLFFPNSWDRHGKNRLLDRFNFFFKYMKRKSGIHEVYMEEQQPELMTYEQFKANITASKQQVPKFFTATALPLYKWALSGTRFSAAILKRVDIMQGSWNELPKSKRWWKSILLIGAFTVSIIYDLIIKILNALMLSINTFTTLGFGEIPIKGLPRYLAIVQGFIGWFMLTIFSVSLISQLLN